MIIVMIVTIVLGMTACGMPELHPPESASDSTSQSTGAGNSGSPPASASGYSSSSAASATSTTPATGSPAATSSASGTAAGAAPPSTYAKPSPLPLVINEILYDVPGEDTNGDVFVELRGTPGGDVGGFQLLFINGDDGKKMEDIMLPAGLLVPEDGLLVIADGITGDLQHTHVPNADFLDNFDPQNGPDAVQLLGADGGLLDALGYGGLKQTTAFNNLAMLEGSAGPDAPVSQSVSRLPDAMDSNDNAADFVINPTPSPGAYE